MIFRVLKWAKPSVPALFTLMAILIAIPVFAMYYENLRVNVKVNTGEVDAKITDAKGYVIQQSVCCHCNCSCNCSNQSGGRPSGHSTTTTLTTTTPVRGGGRDDNNNGNTSNDGEGCGCGNDCHHECNYTECVAMYPASLVLGPNGQYLDVFLSVNATDSHHHDGHDDNCNCSNDHDSNNDHGCCDCCGCDGHGCHCGTVSNEFWVGIVFENTGTIPIMFTHLSVVDYWGNITSWEVTSRFYGPYAGSLSGSPVWGLIECDDLPVSGNSSLPMQLEPGEKAVVWIHIVINKEGQFKIRITPGYVQFNMAP